MTMEIRKTNMQSFQRLARKMLVSAREAPNEKDDVDSSAWSFRFFSQERNTLAWSLLLYSVFIAFGVIVFALDVSVLVLCKVIGMNDGNLVEVYYFLCMTALSVLYL
jgi:hypothetical protein